MISDLCCFSPVLHRHLTYKDLIFSGIQNPDSGSPRDIAGLHQRRLVDGSFMCSCKFSSRFVHHKSAFVDRRKRYAITLPSAIAFFLSTTSGNALSLKAMKNSGIGNVVGNNIMPMNMSLFTTVILANLPQTILSYIYLSFNWLCTCMYAGHEWMKYASHRRPLRVTSPIGAQRSTYYLQLPYRYSIPLITLSSLLAWLTSQSFFLVQIKVMDHGSESDKSISSCGYSPGAIALAMIVGSIIFLATVLIGLRQYPIGMPLAATNSMGISAACHAPPDDLDASVLPVQWGVVSVKEGVGHCSFSSKLVAPPIPGREYAGTVEDLRAQLRVRNRLSRGEQVLSPPK